MSCRPRYLVSSAVSVSFPPTYQHIALLSVVHSARRNPLAPQIPLRRPTHMLADKTPLIFHSEVYSPSQAQACILKLRTRKNSLARAVPRHMFFTMDRFNLGPNPEKSKLRNRSIMTTNTSEYGRLIDLHIMEKAVVQMSVIGVSVEVVKYRNWGR